jgi:hypothetical protein
MRNANGERKGALKLQPVDEHFAGKKRDHRKTGRITSHYFSQNSSARIRSIGIQLDRMKKHLEQRKMAAVIGRGLLTTQPELAHLIEVERHR